MQSKLMFGMTKARSGASDSSEYMDTWTSMNLHEPPRTSKDIHRHPQTSTDIHGIPPSLVEISGRCTLFLCYSKAAARVHIPAYHCSQVPVSGPFKAGEDG